MGEPERDETGIELWNQEPLDERTKQKVIKLLRGPYRAANLSLAGVEEILRMTRHVASMLIYSAVSDALIKDEEIEGMTQIYYQHELIASKVTAYEWIFKPWLGMKPRLAIEEVAPVVHLHPDFIRFRLLGNENFTGPTRYRMKPGYRIAELWDDLCPVCEGKRTILDLEGTGRVVCPSCDGLGTKREDRGRRDPGLIEEVPQPLLLPPPQGLPPPVPPERAEAAREIMKGLVQDAKAQPAATPDEIAQTCCVGLDILGDAPSGIRYDTDK